MMSLLCKPSFCVDKAEWSVDLPIPAAIAAGAWPSTPIPDLTSEGPQMVASLLVNA